MSSYTTISTARRSRSQGSRTPIVPNPDPSNFVEQLSRVFDEKLSQIESVLSARIETLESRLDAGTTPPAASEEHEDEDHAIAQATAPTSRGPSRGDGQDLAAPASESRVGKRGEDPARGHAQPSNGHEAPVVATVAGSRRSGTTQGARTTTEATGSRPVGRTRTAIADGSSDGEESDPEEQVPRGGGGGSGDPDDDEGSETGGGDADESVDSVTFNPLTAFSHVDVSFFSGARNRHVRMRDVEEEGVEFWEGEVAVAAYPGAADVSDLRRAALANYLGKRGFPSDSPTSDEVMRLLIGPMPASAPTNLQHMHQQARDDILFVLNQMKVSGALGQSDARLLTRALADGICAAYTAANPVRLATRTTIHDLKPKTDVPLQNADRNTVNV